ncbi:MAG: HAMP domain-containing histidine kinase [Clostridia bacterium]|nr:HAMP domain-containing histidine kinase [Clostridia bacterium]
MNEIKEFNSIKNGIALKAVGKIIIYTIISIIVVMILIDGVFNDQIAEEVHDLNDFIYYFMVSEKPIIITIMLFIIVTIVSFFVIRNTSNNLIIIISAMNQISINPDEAVKLPTNLAIIENKLNNIRIELIKNRNEAKEAENKKNDLIMYMAHDLKTPLTSIIGYLTLLLDEQYISKPLQEKYMQIALDKAFRVEDLTNQFFEITRYNLHDMPINKQKINLSFLIDQLIEECYPMLQERNLKCIINKPDNVYFLGDGDKLARGFGNLIKNAINYSYENTNIEIEIVQDEKHIQVIFKNKGDKIPKYKLDKIFDKFYRADESRKSDKGGAGLGLAITKEIIELHGGNIYVKNDNDLIEFYIEFYNLQS